MPFGARFGTFIVAVVLLYLARKAHKSAKHPTAMKFIGVIGAFLAGCATLVTFVGSWMTSNPLVEGGVGGGILLLCLGIIAIDLHDGKPDKPAFWASFALAMAFVIGAAQLPAAWDQISQGGSQVESTITNGSGK